MSNYKILRTMVLVVAIACTGAGYAATDMPKTVNVVAGSLADALESLAKQYGVDVIYPSTQLKGLTTEGVKGTLQVREAFERLVEGTSLVVKEQNGSVLIAMPSGIAPPKASSDVAQAANLRLVQGEKSENSGNMQKVEAQSSPSKSEASSSDEGEESSKATPELLVTGSRIARTPSQMAANVITLDADALRATGEVTLEAALRQLPQNIFGATPVGAAVSGSGMSFSGAINITGGSSINLRGLGGESTLVLIDGRRIGKSGVFGGITDITGIPLSSVERVDIMLDGASSIYGSDAVGGVVNIILRKDYRGLELAMEYGRPQDAGFDESVASVGGGTAWRGGRGHFSFEHFNHSNLDGAERPERITSLRYSAPAMVAGGGELFYIYEGQRYRGDELPGLGLTPTSPGVVGVLYTMLPANAGDGSGLTLNDFTPLTYSESFHQGIGEGISILPAQERNTVQAGAEQSISLGGADLTLSATAYYSDRKTYAANGAFEVMGFIDAANPRNPFGRRFPLYWSIPTLPDRHYETGQQVSRWTAGVEGRLSSRWQWQLFLGRSEDRIEGRYYNESVDTDVSSQLQTQGLNFLAADIVAYNNPALLAALVLPEARLTRAMNGEDSLEFGVSGSFGKLPAGAIHLAVGADWRKERLQTQSQRSIVQTGLGDGSNSLPYGEYERVALDRSQYAAFMEALIPIVGQANARAGLRALSLTGSLRHDSFGNYDSAFTRSLGVIYSPLREVTLKVNHSTSYVIPTFREALLPASVFDITGLYQSLGIDMPGSPIYLQDEAGNFTGELEYMGTQISGGNPDLRPETAKTLSAGLEFKSARVEGLTLAAVWHRTRYSNRIGAVPYPSFIVGTDYVGLYPNVTRYESDLWAPGLLTLDFRSINAALVETSGIDYSLSFNRETPWGQFLVTGNVAYTHRYDRTAFEGHPAVNEVGDVGIETLSAIPEYRYSTNIGWYRNGFSLNVDASTARETSSTGISYGINGGEQRTFRRVSSYPVNVDLIAAYTLERGRMDVPAWLRDTRVSFRILNLFEDQPGYSVTVIDANNPAEPVNVPADAEFNSNLADPRGRMLYLGLSKNF